MTHTEWHGCYDNGWHDLIVPEAFAHPAKFSYGLITRIVEHMTLRGWLKPGDVIGDPFGGVGLGGLVAAYHGYRWVGVELEPKFVELAGQNFELHRRKWAALNELLPVIVQGDSRRFAAIVGECACVVSSPPYADTPIQGGGANAYGAKKQFDETGIWPKGSLAKTAKGGEGYSHTPGNIGNAKAGSVDAVISSPPYESKQLSNHDSPKNYAEMEKTWPNKSFGRSVGLGYGISDGQIGDTSGDSYWQAMDAVYRQCHAAIKPGGHAAIVIKDYIAKGKRVPLCDDTLRLLQHAGFEPVERVRAMLVKETTHAGLFGDITETKARKSFFRRLAEAKGSPPIDWEEVLFVRRA